MTNSKKKSTLPLSAPFSAKTQPPSSHLASTRSLPRISKNSLQLPISSLQRTLGVLLDYSCNLMEALLLWLQQQVPSSESKLAMTLFCAFSTVSSQTQHPLTPRFLSHGHTTSDCNTPCLAVVLLKSPCQLIRNCLSILPDRRHLRTLRIRQPFHSHGMTSRRGCNGRRESSCLRRG